jgi:cytochrome c553
MTRLPSRIAALLAAAWLLPPAAAADPALDAKGVEFFETKIRPVLVAQCYECHSEKSAKVKGGLLLDTRDGLLKGGDTGPALVPGKPAESTLVKLLKADKGLMPPKQKLADHVVADFEKWVAMGAPDPRAGGAGYKRMSAEEAKTFWSLKPVTSPAVPAVKGTWAKTDIDRFVLAKMEAQGLKPVGDADRATVVRRLYFDLIGMPPSAEELAAAVADTSPDAVEKIVEKLLASPHFGERWGRYWLDLARYAESNGNADNTPFPLAWKYRDYVIRSVNADKPYDQFVREQVAGDLLPARDDKHRDELLIATGFLALTSKPRAQNNPDYRMDLIADQIDVTGRAILGLSVLCARCHDHKFDPIPQKEYTALAGIFESTQMLFGGGGGKGAKGAGPGGIHTLSDGEQAMGVKDAAKPTESQVYTRGDSTKPAGTVARGFLSIATVIEAPKVPAAKSGRLELAAWLTDAGNPLAARVAANRVWQHLFGRGLCASPDNFGFLGERPSHPELLDHLTTTLVDSGWSTKQLIRSVVLTRTYQMAATADAANAKVDPDGVYLWRKAPRRLDAEAFRDAVLSASGSLNPESPKGSLMPSNFNAKQPPRTTAETPHRSVYLPILRGAPLPEALAVFDVANPNIVVAQREETTVPSQALYLLNSPFVIDQSRKAARRLLADAKLTDEQRADLAYRLALSRPATTEEAARVVAYVRAADPKGGEAAWASFCQALFASAEFRYVR